MIQGIDMDGGVIGNSRSPRGRTNIQVLNVGNHYGRVGNVDDTDTQLIVTRKELQMAEQICKSKETQRDHYEGAWQYLKS